MFTITLKGAPDKNRPDFAKITMIIYRPGFNRVPKVLPVTGPYKNWDQSQQRFRPRTENAAANNALLVSIANMWDEQKVVWTSKELSHYYDKPGSSCCGRRLSLPSSRSTGSGFRKFVRRRR